ncbi:MAG: hypothetical protein FJ148_01665 [Deltaproteobacteria bacterium]|nr:hypothetical protein [Deltaproteobacteria bacterium]
MRCGASRPCRASRCWRSRRSSRPRDRRARTPGPRRPSPGPRARRRTVSRPPRSTRPRRAC